MTHFDALGLAGVSLEDMIDGMVPTHTHADHDDIDLDEEDSAAAEIARMSPEKYRAMEKWKSMNPEEQKEAIAKVRERKKKKALWEQAEGVLMAIKRDTTVWSRIEDPLDNVKTAPERSLPRMEITKGFVARGPDVPFPAFVRVCFKPNKTFIDEFFTQINDRTLKGKMPLPSRPPMAQGFADESLARQVFAYFCHPDYEEEEAEDWEVHESPDGIKFYYNVVTQQSLWERPLVLLADDGTSSVKSYPTSRSSIASEKSGKREPPQKSDEDIPLQDLDEEAMAKAIKLWQDAASRGDPGGMYNLGRCFATGTGVPKVDHVEAARLYLASANKGYAPGQCALGVAFEKGLGVPIDLKEAVINYQRAAAQAYPKGLINLGVCWKLGKGVPYKDERKAVEMYLAAYENDPDNSIACFNLARCLRNGEGVEQDVEKAASLYEKAARQGLVRALNNLGRLYVDGTGVDRDYAKALFLFKSAADTGHKRARANLAELIRVLRVSGKTGSEIETMEREAREAWGKPPPREIDNSKQEARAALMELVRDERQKFTVSVWGRFYAAACDWSRRYITHMNKWDAEQAMRIQCHNVFGVKPAEVLPSRSAVVYPSLKLFGLRHPNFGIREFLKAFCKPNPEWNMPQLKNGGSETKSESPVDSKLDGPLSSARSDEKTTGDTSGVPIEGSGESKGEDVEAVGTVKEAPQGERLEEDHHESRPKSASISDGASVISALEAKGPLKEEEAMGTGRSVGSLDSGRSK